MAKLTAVIITYNEEKNIGRCLVSLKKICDEIIVMDSFSTDNTEEICKREGAIFYQNKWLGYAGSKNLANEKASNDWVLSIDADESVNPELAISILKIKGELDKCFYSFNRLTNYCGTWIKYSGWYPDTKIRIFNRQRAYWEGIIHEKLIFDDRIPVHNLKGDLFHYSYYTREDHEKQIEKFSTLAAEELKAKGKKTNLLKQFFMPASKFIETYIFKKAFLDGIAGYKISIMTAKATKLKHQKLRRL